MGGIELVVTDLDGTLWHGHEQTHPETVVAWRELERRGIPVMVATGRRAASTRGPLAALGFAPPAAVMNGALVLDLADDRRYHRQAHDPTAARRILDAFIAAGLDPCVYVDHPRYDAFHGSSPSTHPDHLAGLGSSAAAADLTAVVEEVPVLMFGIVGHAVEPLRSVAAAVIGIGEVHVSASDQWGGHTCTVTPLGLSKWVGVVEYCEQTGADSSRVLAIGDGPNDVELLAAAAVSVVPADGSHEALALADHVVASPRDGGWSALLDLV